MNRPILITALGVILVLVLGFSLVRPTYQEFRALRTEIKEKEIMLRYTKEYFSQLRETSETLKEYKEPLSKISTAFPSTPSMPLLFNFLQKTAGQTGLILEDINFGEAITPQPKKGEEAKKIKEIRGNLALSGSYSALKDFLGAIEKSARLLEVEDVSFSSPKTPKESFSFKISLKTYSY